MSTVINPGPDAEVVTIGGFALPKAAETQHVLLVGTTGTGKTTAISEMICAARGRADRMIICDPGGWYLSRFARTGDRVLNAFDTRSPGWTIFSEIRRDFDADRLARSVVPDGRGDAAAWHHYAQVFLAAVIRALIRSGQMTTESLVRTCTAEPASVLVPMLAGTPAAGLLEPEAAKALASTRFVLAAHLQAHAYLRHGDFSIRQWVTSSTGSMFLTWRSDMQRALAPLMAAWLDIAINAILSMEPDRERRMWLVIDELAALGKLSSLAEALTLGRKHGLCVVAGLQSTAQLDDLYGRSHAVTLRSCFRTLGVLGVSRTDPDTAEVLSRSLGERETTRNEESRSLGDQGFGRSANSRRVTERLVLPGEIAGLADLSGFLAIAGTSTIKRLALTPSDLPQRIAPIVEEGDES